MEEGKHALAYSKALCRILKGQVRVALGATFLICSALDGQVVAQEYSSLCDEAIERVAAFSASIPEGLLRAIALTESGRQVNGEMVPWPWTLNVAGEGFFADTREVALERAEQSLAEAQGNVDLGCMQISESWHGWAFASVDEMLTPEENVAYGADFLLGLHAETGSWSAAVAAYHSRNPSLGYAYAQRVLSRWRSIVDPQVIEEFAPDFSDVESRAQRYADLREIESVASEYFLDILISDFYRASLQYVAIGEDGRTYVAKDAFAEVPSNEGYQLPLVLYADALMVDVTGIVPQPRVVLNEEEELLEIFLAADFFTPKVQDLAPRLTAGDLSRRGTGAHLNYALSLQRSSEGGLDSSLYLGGVAYRENLTFSTDFSLASDQGLRRLSTTMYLHDHDGRREWQFGDTLLRGGVRVGSARPVLGFTYNSANELDPGFLRYQDYSVYDISDLPVIVEIVESGESIRKVELPPGPFSLENLPVPNVHGNLDIVITDTLGNRREAEVPYIRVPRILREGVHEFQWGAGLERSSDRSRIGNYGGFVASTTHRYGISDKLTAELHASVSKDRQLVALALDRADTEASLLYGASLSVSNSKLDRGARVGFSLSQLRRRDRFFGAFSLSYSTSGFSIGSGGIARREGERWQIRWNPNLTAIGIPLNLGYNYSKSWSGEFKHSIGSSHSRSIAGGWQLSSSVQAVSGSSGHDFRGLLTISRPFSAGRRLKSSTISVSERRAQLFNSLVQYPSSDGGIGYRISSSASLRDRALRSVEAQVSSYRSWGRLGASLRREGNGNHDLGITLSGSIGWFDGEFFTARSLDAPFAFVRTGDAEGLPLYLNYNRVAESRTGGWAVIDGLVRLERNRIHFPQESLDFSLAFPEGGSDASVEVIPSLPGGYPIDFPIRQQFPVSIILYGESDVPLPSGSRVQNVLTGEISFVTLNGLVYLADMSDGGELEVDLGRFGTCQLEVHISSETMPFDTIGPLACRSSE